MSKPLTFAFLPKGTRFRIIDRVNGQVRNDQGIWWKVSETQASPSGSYLPCDFEADRPVKAIHAPKAK